jgi:regulatory protein
LQYIVLCLVPTAVILLSGLRLFVFQDQVMAVITTLEIQKRNKERVNVYLDGEYAFSLTLLEAARLHKGQALSEAEIAELRSTDAVNRAVDHAARFLSYRPRSVQETRRNLENKDLPQPAIDAAIERLTDMGYLDDLAFARYWLENRTAFKPRGPKALRYELRQKGVRDSVIAAVLEDIDVGDAAYRAAQQKAGRLRGSSRREFHNKLGSFLQRRGFTYSISRDVIEQLIQELAEEDPDFFFTDDTEEEP